MFKGLRTYIKIIHKVSPKSFDAVIVPLQSRIDEQMKQVTPDKWSADMVHPYVWAHAWVTQRWLEATGL